MESANAAVFLRRNNQVQDAIDGQNLKQALQLIEKRIKKGEDTVFLKVSCHVVLPLQLHIHISPRSLDPSTLTAGLVGLESAHPLPSCGRCG